MTPPAPPLTYEDLGRGEEELRDGLSELERALVDHRSRFSETLRESISVPLRRAFQRAAEAHDKLLEESGLLGTRKEGRGVSDEAKGESLPEARPARQWQRTYQDGVGRAVLTPLEEDLRALDLPRVVGGVWAGFLDGLPTLGKGLPEEILREEPTGLLGSEPGESLTIALRKITERWQRALGAAPGRILKSTLALVGRQDEPTLPPVQRVPLQSLAEECLLGQCPVALAEVGDSLNAHYCDPISRLVTAVSLWSGGWLAMEEGGGEGEDAPGPGFEETILELLDPPESREGEGSPPEEPVESEEPVDAMEGPDLLALSRDLGNTLKEGADLAEPSAVLALLERTMLGEWTRFLEEVRVAGTRLRSSSRGERDRAERASVLMRRRTEALAAWYRGALERIRLSRLLIRLREGFRGTEDGLLRRVEGEALSPLIGAWTRARSVLLDLRAEGQTLYSGYLAGQEPGTLSQGVEGLLDRTQSLLAAELVQDEHSRHAQGLVREAADEAVGRLADTFRFLPESITVPSGSEVGPVGGSPGPTRELPLRDIAQQTVDVLRLEEIRNSAQHLLRFLEVLPERTREISGVATFNLKTALDELRSPPPEGVPEEIVDDARSLSEEGLTRTTAGIDGLMRELATAWGEFSRAVNGRLVESFREIHLRAQADGVVEEQILGLQTQARSSLRKYSEALRGASEKAERTLARLLRKGWIRGVRLVRLGRSAVGAGADQAAESERALEMLRRVPSLLEELPLVYRRLFPFQPVSDPGLLVGRKVELDWIARRLESWRGGWGTPCILTGPVAGGHTSLLNIVASETLDDFQLCRFEVPERIRTAEGLSELLAQALGMEKASDPWTLPVLAEAIHGRPPGAKPIAILLEHMELLVLRTPGGTDLVRDFLSFQAQTSKEIFWLSTVSGATWKFVEKSEPQVTALVTQTGISPLSAVNVEEMIMARHRRSGLPLEFIQPNDLNALLRRKLRLARGEEAKQEILRKESFERLYRMSEGSLAMAMLAWLRSADFMSREGWLRVSPPKPVRFAFLDAMDLNMDFSLKAFLEHGSLTLGEYAEVFNCPEEEAFQTFQALRSRMLLEAVRGQDGTRAHPGGVVEEGRFRIPGLLSQAVASRLKNRNILH